MKKVKKSVTKKKSPVKQPAVKKLKAAVAKATKAVKAAKQSADAPAPVEVVDDNREPRKLRLSKDDAAKFKKLLLDLRDHLIDGVNFLATDNLKRSNRDASGELSGYSLHMADAGTDNFDREFALSLVSSEQEGLYEIEEALKRLEDGRYGVCDMCEKLIMKERLEAVPFARRCVQCQAAAEKDRRFQSRQGPTFVEGDEGDGDGEDSEE